MPFSLAFCDAPFGTCRVSHRVGRLFVIQWFQILINRWCFGRVRRHYWYAWMVVERSGIPSRQSLILTWYQVYDTTRICDTTMLSVCMCVGGACDITVWVNLVWWWDPLGIQSTDLPSQCSVAPKGTSVAPRPVVPFYIWIAHGSVHVDYYRYMIYGTYIWYQI